MSEQPASNETDRRIGDVARFGRVTSVDLAGGLCTVACGDIESGPIPWIAGRAGSTRVWSPPTVGEQVMLLCEDGDLGLGAALLGVFSNASPAPADADIFHAEFEDEAVISYDPSAHALKVILPAGATVEITAPGGLTINAEDGVTVNAAQGATINADAGVTIAAAGGGVAITGDVTVDGKIDATGDVTTTADVKAGPISLKTHKTLGVTTGGGTSGLPTP